MTQIAANAASVLVVDPLHPYALRELGHRYRVVLQLQPRPEALPALLAPADAIVLRSGIELSAATLDHAPQLRVIARAGVGTDNIDLERARDRGIIVFNVPGESTGTVAEFTIGLLLALARHIALADRYVRQSSWPKAQLVGVELHGKTLGIVGVGAIGERVAALAQAFGMRTVGCVRDASSERVAALASLNIEVLPLSALLASSDVVSLHVPLTSSTRGLIGWGELTSMRSHALLINVARGGVVDEDALFQALVRGTIAGAALDVFAHEGRPTPLARLDNVIATPHIGAMTVEAQERVARTLVEKLVLGLDGRDVSNVLPARAP